MTVKVTDGCKEIKNNDIDDEQFPKNDDDEPR